MRYLVLGPLTVVSADGGSAALGGPKQRLVLASLVLAAGRSVPDDDLVDTVWPTDPPPRARHALQTYVSQLRGVVDDRIERSGGGYRLAVEPEVVDAHRFVTLAAAGRDHLEAAPASAAALLRDALALWRGPPLVDLGSHRAPLPQVQRLGELRIDAVEDRLAADLATGLHREVAAELEALTEEHPYRERLHELHLLALYRSGRQVDALQAYRRVHQRLAEELGVEPGEPLQALHLRILRHDRSLTAAGARSSEAPSGAMALPAVRGFELRERVGAGPHGTVFRAYEPRSGREVAVKLLTDALFADPGLVASLEARWDRLRQLEHRHLLPILDHWRDPDGAYLVSPWIAHGSLEQALHHGPWSLPAALRLLEQVGDALTTLQAVGLAHGHVVASNVLLDGAGDALLSDVALSDLAARVQGDMRRRPEQAGDAHDLARLMLRTLTGTGAPTASPEALRRSRPDVPDAVVRALATGFGTDSDVEVEGLVSAVRRAAGADVVGLGGTHGASWVRNPYKGLEPFREADAADLHGRDADIQRVIATLDAHRLVAVVGPSGCGKSSLVRAGVMPRLRTAGGHASVTGWLVADMYPGPDPFEALATALLQVSSHRPDGLLTQLLDAPDGIVRLAERILPEGTNLLVMIDQFEELYTRTTDHTRRRAFEDVLVAAASAPEARIRFLVTLRADHLDRPLERHGLGALVRAGLVPVAVPSPSELTAAVVRPAASVGVGFEEGLVGELVADVADQPGSLPLLQHVLSELFRRRQGSAVTATAVHEVGGVRGALARRAEELYRSLSPEGQHVARQLFLRLVTLDGPDGVALRRRIRRSELTALGLDPEEVETVLRRFGAHRLVTFDRDATTRGATVEAAHEALFEAWPRLSRWIDEARDDLQHRRRLTDAALDWEAGRHEEALLLTGPRLAAFEAWADTTALALDGSEQALLTASREHRDRDANRRRRRRRQVVGALLSLSLTALALAGVATVQRDRSIAAEASAATRALAAASAAELSRDGDLALLLALAAVEVHRNDGRPPTDAAVEALHEAVLAHRVRYRIPDAGGVEVAGTDHLVVSGWDDFGPQVLELRSGRVLHRLPAVQGRVTGIAASADGRRAAITYEGAAPTRVLDVETGEEIAQLESAGPARFAPSFSADGTRLALVEVDPVNGPGAGPPATSVVIHDLGNLRELLRLPGAAQEMHAALHPDGDRIAVPGPTGLTVSIHAVSDGTLLQTVGDPDDLREVWQLAWSPSGDRLVVQTTLPRAEVLLFDPTDGAQELRVPAGSDPTDLCLSADGNRLVTGSADDRVQIWDARTGEPVTTLPGRALAVACSPGGEQVVVSGSDRAALVLDVTATGATEVVTIPAVDPWTVAWSADGSRLVSSHLDGTLQVHDATTGERLHLRDDQTLTPPLWLAVTERLVAANAAAGETGSDGRRLTLYESATLNPRRALDSSALPIAFDTDGRLLLAGELGRATLFDADTGQVVQYLEPPELASPELGQVVDGAIHPDGDRVLVSVAADRAWWFDRRSGRAMALPASGPVRRVALSPEGDRLALGVQDGSVDVILVSDLDLGTPTVAVPTPATVTLQAGGLAFGLDFSPDGSLIATAGFEGQLALWDAATGERRLAIGHDGRVGGAVFSPDGRRLAVAVDTPVPDADALRVYTLDVDELIMIAYSKLTRELSAEECRTYLADRCPTY